MVVLIACVTCAKAKAKCDKKVSNESRSMDTFQLWLSRNASICY